MAWNTIPLSTEFEIDSFGGVRYLNSNALIAIRVGRDGYNWIDVWSNDDDIVSLRVDEAMLNAHVGPPGPGEVVNHIDGDNRNDLESNLEWV